VQDVTADVQTCLATCRGPDAVRDCAMDCAGVLAEGTAACQEDARLCAVSCGGSRSDSARSRE
jgi:hypothetical protein